jgi:hypothetical protein
MFGTCSEGSTSATFGGSPYASDVSPYIVAGTEFGVEIQLASIFSNIYHIARSE